MKYGYIVMNESTSGNEYFGVYKNKKTAERQLRKAIRNRYGRCPRNLINVADLEMDDDRGSDSYKIVYFEENTGESL